MGESDPERRRIRGQTVGHGQRMEPSADREAVHGQLPAVHVFLDEHGRAARRVERDLDGRGHSARVRDKRQAALALPIRSFHDTGKADAFCGGDRLPGPRADDELRLRNPGLHEALALA